MKSGKGTQTKTKCEGGICLNKECEDLLEQPFLQVDRRCQVFIAETES